MLHIFSPNTKNSSKPTLNRLPHPIESFLAGGLGGLTMMLVMHPFDNLRRFIWNEKFLGSNPLPLRTLKDDGIKWIYRGLSLPIRCEILYKSIAFGAGTTSGVVLFKRNQSHTNTFLSACIAGIVNSIILVPIENIRNKMPMMKTPSTVLNLLTWEIRSLGLISLWKNFSWTLLRDTPGIGIYLLSYDVSKKNLNINLPEQYKYLTVKCLSGIISGIAYWSWGIPIDILRNTFLTNRDKFIQYHDNVYQLLRHEVPIHIKLNASTYFINYCRNITAAAITIVTYDLVIDNIFHNKIFE